MAWSPDVAYQLIGSGLWVGACQMNGSSLWAGRGSGSHVVLGVQGCFQHARHSLSRLGLLPAWKCKCVASIAIHTWLATAGSGLPGCVGGGVG